MLTLVTTCPRMGHVDTGVVRWWDSGNHSSLTLSWGSQAPGLPLPGFLASVSTGLHIPWTLPSIYLLLCLLGMRQGTGNTRNCPPSKMLATGLPLVTFITPTLPTIRVHLGSLADDPVPCKSTACLSPHSSKNKMLLGLMWLSRSLTLHISMFSSLGTGQGLMSTEEELECTSLMTCSLVKVRTRGQRLLEHYVCWQVSYQTS